MRDVLPLLLALTLAGCDPATSDPGDGTTVTLRNANAATAHILTAAETASASTELSSGATRRVAVAPGQRGDERFFRLVLDEVEVQQIGCFLNNGIGPGTEVVHTAEGALVCLRW